MKNLYDQDSLTIMAFAEEAYVRGSSRLEELS